MTQQVVVDSIDSVIPLEPIGRTIKQTVERTYASAGTAGDSVRNALRGKWLGHPLHPILTDIPIGAWSTAAVLDLAGFTGAADTAIAVGLAGAAMAIASGLTDYDDTKPPATKLGASHAIFNAAATALYAMSLAARRSGRRGTGIVLSLGGLGCLGAGGYLGGELVFNQPGAQAEAPASSPAAAGGFDLQRAGHE